MKTILKNTFVMLVVFVFANIFVACENVCKNCGVAEEISLSKTVLGEVEFENANTVNIEQDKNNYKITGNIDSMSLEQASSFGVQDVTHVVVVKFVFDKERTIDSFEIKGNTIKVFSTDDTVNNYIAPISELLDNEPSEDAFCYLILSAHTNSYTFTSKYTDSTESILTLSIDVNLIS